MPILYLRESPEISLDIYDRVRSRVAEGPMPQGFLHHYACAGDRGGVVVVEIWESEEAQDRWAAQVDKTIAEAGAPPRPAPRKMTVHNEITPEKSHA